MRQYYTGECGKVAVMMKLGDASLVEMASKGANVAESIVDFCEDPKVQAEVVVMTSVKLNSVKRKHVLGSVCSAVTKDINGHFYLIKNTSLT